MLCILIALFYIPIAIALGWLNAHLVEKKGAPGKKKIIKHFWNGLLHCGAAIGVYSITMDWKDAAATLCIARLFFNESYNYFHIPRHPLGYISKTSKSVIDRIQYWLASKQRIVPVVILIIAIVTLLIWK
jgi:peptidoglycan/LPS O-acetylase OafA/YrhL